MATKTRLTSKRKRKPVLKSPLNDAQIAIVKGMLARGDHQHDIAAYYRINQGRINEIAKGYAGAKIAAATDLPVKVEPAYEWPGGSAPDLTQPPSRLVLEDPPAPPPASFTTGEITPAHVMPAHLSPKDLGAGAVNWIRDEAGKVETAIAGTSLWQKIKAKLPSGGTWIFVIVIAISILAVLWAVLT